MKAESDKGLTVGLVGYGRLARHLAPALVDAGIVINQWYVRNPTFNNEILNSYHLRAVNELRAINEDSDIIVIMISDHAIAEVATQLQIKSTIVCHTSGMSLINVLPQANAGILYPLNTFNGLDPIWSYDTPLFIQAKNEKTFVLLEQLACLLSHHVQRIKPDDLQTIHLAAVIAQNFSNHLIAKAEEVLIAKGIDRQVLYPLLSTMIKNLRHTPAALNQTGPAIRNDENTIIKQQKLLEKNQDLQSLYTQLTKSIGANKND